MMRKVTERAKMMRNVPQYVIDHAPLLHLYGDDEYRPSSIAQHIENTHAEVDFQRVCMVATGAPPLLSLSRLDRLNPLGTSVYLTSNQDITAKPMPEFLLGLNPDVDGKIADAITGVVVVVEKGNGVVDAFYFYFFSYNWGGVVLEQQLGNHVGDWEHNMIRFRNGQPEAMWLSQHANGEAFTFKCLQKDRSGKRPICYVANGTHALYATPGLHDHTIPNVNLASPLLLVDNTEAGPLFDPLASSYYYSYVLPVKPYEPVTDGFLPLKPTADAPNGFLRYTGRWGDEAYPSTDARQTAFFGNNKFVSGPTGPLYKQLMRQQVWPENAFSEWQTLRTSLRPGLLQYLRDLLREKRGQRKVELRRTADGKMVNVVRYRGRVVKLGEDKEKKDEEDREKKARKARKGKGGHLRMGRSPCEAAK
ncbi:hypothetical protein ACN47E_009494 [Coniothyrium glycines]